MSNNKYLGRYYDCLLAGFDEVSVVEAPAELVYSDFAHKWGKDFFHYSDRYYMAVADKIRALGGECGRV